MFFLWSQGSRIIQRKRYCRLTKKAARDKGGGKRGYILSYQRDFNMIIEGNQVFVDGQLIVNAACDVVSLPPGWTYDRLIAEICTETDKNKKPLSQKEQREVRRQIAAGKRKAAAFNARYSPHPDDFVNGRRFRYSDKYVVMSVARPRLNVTSRDNSRSVRRANPVLASASPGGGDSGGDSNSGGSSDSSGESDPPRPGRSRASQSLSLKNHPRLKNLIRWPYNRSCCSSSKARWA